MTMTMTTMMTMTMTMTMTMMMIPQLGYAFGVLTFVTVKVMMSSVLYGWLAPPPDSGALGQIEKRSS